MPKKMKNNPPMPPMKKICVYCGAKPGQEIYGNAADALGGELTRRGIGLVYGGGRTGLMGRIADAVMENGGEVIGVIPHSLLSIEDAHQNISELKVVDDMHARKALMAKLADGFIAMPGGLGTLEELFEALAWAQLKFHRKPCAVLNIDGFYDRLADFLDHAVAEGFIKTDHRKLMLIDDSPAALLDKMARFAAA